MSEPTWLDLAKVIALNREIVAWSGEPHHVVDYGGLESAIARPVNSYFYGTADVAYLAADLLYGIAANHPFMQGNKRTALVAAEVFLRLNGFDLHLPDREFVAAMVINAVTGSVSVEELADMLDAYMLP